MSLFEILELIKKRIDVSIMGIDFDFIVDYDKKYTKKVYNEETWSNKEVGRIYIQPFYKAPCTKTGVHNTWKGAKWYLSSHMTENEIIGTAFKAIKAAVEHEILEGFKVDGVILFNPHVDFAKLIEFNRTAPESTRK